MSIPTILLFLVYMNSTATNIATFKNYTLNLEPCLVKPHHSPVHLCPKILSPYSYLKAFGLLCTAQRHSIDASASCVDGT